MRAILRCLPLILCAAVVAQPGVHPDELALKPKIDDAISRGVESLLAAQHRDGSWGLHGNYRGGRTGLCAYALLKSGVPAEHPALQRAFTHLDAIDPDKTYSTACMMLAYGALGTRDGDARVASLLQSLLKWQRPGGDWSYPSGAPDLSNTQYAALGLWIAHKCDVPIPRETWDKLARGTLRFREQPRLVDVPIKGETGSGKLQVAGFKYRPGGGKATGSMTSAGVSILQICKLGLGKRIGRSRRQIDDAIEAGLAWLGHNFSVTTNPGHGGHLFYYLYGLERVGSLTGEEKFGDHHWFVEGARELLKRQHKNGSFARSGQGGYVDTCFALLFLRRATRVGPVTGGGSHETRHVFAATGKNDDVSLRGAGQHPLAVWVGGFSERVKQRHATFGIRVLNVTYMEDERKLAEIACDPTKPWVNETYLQWCQALRRGEHPIHVSVTLIAPDCPPGSPGKAEETLKTEEVVSSVMNVRIRDVFEPWMEVAATMQRHNVLRAPGVELTPTASSNPDKAVQAFDGNDSTHWVSAKGDATPTLGFEVKTLIKARRIRLTQPAVHESKIKSFDQITKVELFINKDRKPMVIELHEDPLALTEFDFGKTRRIRRLTLRITERLPGGPGIAGFAEVVLVDREAPSRRR